MHLTFKCFYLFALLSLFLVLSNSQICAHSQYFNGQRCAPCKSNCRCTVDNTCDTCLSGYAFDVRFSNCLQCPPNLGDSINVGCKQCCSQIVGTAFVCSQCAAQDYVFLRGGQCIKSAGCLQLLDSGVCASCQNGYYLMQGKCLACDQSCRTCRDITLCTICKEGYYNSTNTDLSLCTQCPLGCKTCTSGSSCQSCNPGHYLLSSACPHCSSNCLTCTSAACTQCNSISTLIAGVCHLCTDLSKSGSVGCQACQTVNSLIYCTEAAPSYYLNNGQSIACSSTFANSLFCNAMAPTQCQNDYHPTLTSRYHLVNNQCIANTKSCKMMKNTNGQCSQCYFESPDFYYRLSNNECVKCNQLGCKTYSNSCQCLECQEGYRYVNNLCVACQNLHCTRCQNNIQSCQRCANYYGIFSSACILCSKANCLNCDGDYTMCKQCQDGYYLSSGSCFRCQDQCLLCESNTKCTKCSSSQYLQLNGRCKTRPSNCLQVDSRYLGQNVAVCRKCAFGYQVLEGNCYPCSQTLYNLNTCQKYCPSYYALRSNELHLSLGILWIILLSVSIIFL